MMLSAHQLHYLPWLGYFEKISRADFFVFLDLPLFKKREYQNRNIIKGSRGQVLLTVPVVSKRPHRQALKDVLIDNRQSWQQNHWILLERNLCPTPFWEKYSPSLQEFYTQPYESFSALTLAMNLWFITQLGLAKPYKLESEIGTTTTSTDRIIELCKKTAATDFYSGVGGKEYMDEERFKAAGIRLHYQDFRHPWYPQHFGEFTPNLSILDLLMNTGPESKNFLCGL
jgi:hypothetical protein